MISAMRKAHTSIYANLMARGIDAYGHDQLLDKEDIDLVEWFLEVRIWHYFTNKWNEDALKDKGLHYWWVAEKPVAETMLETSQSFGNPDSLIIDIGTLFHSIHDTRLKFMALISLISASDMMSDASFANFFTLFKSIMAESFLQRDQERLMLLFFLGLEKANPQRLHFITEKMSRENLEDAEKIYNNTEKLKQRQKTESKKQDVGLDLQSENQQTQTAVIEVTLDNQNITFLIIDLLRMTFRLYKSQPDYYKSMDLSTEAKSLLPSKKAEAVLSSLLKLEQIKKWPASIQLTEYEAKNWLYASSQVDSGLIDVPHIAIDPDWKLTMTIIFFDIDTLITYMSGEEPEDDAQVLDFGEWGSVDRTWLIRQAEYRHVKRVRVAA